MPRATFLLSTLVAVAAGAQDVAESCAHQGDDMDETSALQVGHRKQAISTPCSVGDHVQCPGSGNMCSGNQCCPRHDVSHGTTFACPSADPAWESLCENPDKVVDCVPPPSRVVIDFLSSHGTGGSGYIKVAVGTPAQAHTVVFDAGSSEFWTRSGPASCGAVIYNPDKSSTAKALGLEMEYVYGGGYMKGPMYQDVLTLYTQAGSSVSLPGINVTAGTAVSLQCYPGILPAAPTSVTMPSIFAALSLPHYFAWDLQRLSICSLADWRNATTRNAWQHGGSIVLGGVDHNAYVGGLVCAPLLPFSERALPPAKPNNNGKLLGMTIDGGERQFTSSMSYWETAVSSVKVGGEVVSLSSMQSIVDTGCSTLVVPVEVLKALAIPDNCKDHPSCSCDDAFKKAKTLELSLPGGQVISLSPQDYMKQVFDSQRNATYCASTVASMPDAPAPFMLGLAFQWKYYVVFDYENNQLAFGLKEGATGEGFQQTCTQPQYVRP